MLIFFTIPRFALNGIKWWVYAIKAFKFNRSWLTDPYFNLWVAKIWSELNPQYPLNGLDNLILKLRTLKREVKAWIKEKDITMSSDSLRLDKDIETLLLGSFSGIISHEDQSTLNQLRSKKKKLQEHNLLTWQLKSRTKWALYGDSNTKFFHAIAFGRRNHNTIWSLEDEEGHCVQDEHALKELGKIYFA